MYNWVILHIKGHNIYKLLMDVGPNQNDWYLNSGITKVVEHPTHYSIYGVSGSVYDVDKEFEEIGHAGTYFLAKVPQGMAEIVKLKDTPLV
jgi:hypothetical protein